MLEIGADNSNPGDLIKDVNEDTFMTDVVEASQEVPVIVDFWAPWCGPCKTLGPMLEKAVLASKGAVRMVKVKKEAVEKFHENMMEREEKLSKERRNFTAEQRKIKAMVGLLAWCQTS